MKGIYKSIKKRIARFIAQYADTDDRIDYIRHYDSLIELPNRKILIDTFNPSIESSEKVGRAIMVINIDRLHSINELYGRDIGDEVIIKLSDRLRQVFKGENTVFREDHFYLCLVEISAGNLEQTGQAIL